jgi:hypothetical protein
MRQVIDSFRLSGAGSYDQPERKAILGASQNEKPAVR